MFVLYKYRPNDFLYVKNLSSSVRRRMAIFTVIYRRHFFDDSVVLIEVFLDSSRTEFIFMLSKVSKLSPGVSHSDMMMTIGGLAKAPALFHK